MEFPPEEVAVRHGKSVEVFAQRSCIAEVGIFNRRIPDQAASLATGQFGEPEISLVHAGKGFRPGQGEQLAIKLVGPGVIGADEPLGTLHLLPFDKPRPAMPADIEEDVRLPFRIACDEKGTTGRVVRNRHAGIGDQCRGAQYLRQPVEQPGFFPFEMRRVGIGARRDMRDRIAFAHLARSDIPGQRQLPLGRAQRW